MNDFFSVLDDFEFEEFAAPESVADDSVGFSLDVASDGSVIPEYTEQKLDDVKTDAETVTEADVENGTNYVWQNGTDPFSRSTSTAGVYLSFSNVIDRTTGGGADGTLPYKEVNLSLVAGLSFTKAVTADNGLVIDSTNIGITATAGVDVALNSGHVTGGKFSLGTARIAIGTPGADLTDATEIAVDGFEDGAVSFDATDNNLTAVNNGGDLEGTLTVTGDYDFTYEGNAVKITGVADDQTLSIGPDDHDHVALDLSDVEAVAGSTLRVVSAGGADAIIPPTDADGGEIRIGTTTYTYTNASGEAEFLVDGTTVEGYLLAGIGDAIDVDKTTALTIYDAEDADKVITTVSGQDYTITKLASGYQAVIENSSTITIGETKLSFNITSATRNSADFADGVTILFNEDGEITSVAGLEDFTSAKDTMTVEGATVYDERGGLPILTGDTLGYISVNTGDFTYAGGEEPSVTVADDGNVQVFSVNGTKLIYVGESGGTITDGDGAEFEYSGKGYLIGENEEITGFVFVATGDSIVLPTEDAIDVFDGDSDTALDIPAVTDSDDEYTLTKTADGFRISGLEAGAVVDDYTFTNAGGYVDFDDEGEITGIGGYVGTLALTEADSGLTINGDTLTFDFADDDQVITATVDTSGVSNVTGLNDGDTISSTNDATKFVFFTDTTDDDTHDTFTVNGNTFDIYNDNNNVTITAGGEVSGLDEDAYMTASAGPITVNSVPYSADEITTANETNEAIIGYQPKDEDKEVSSFITDYAHPIFFSGTTDEDLQGVRWLNTNYANTYRESVVDASELDRSADDDTINSRIYLDGTDPDATTTVTFNDAGDNLAIVEDGAKGTKNIILGDRGDAVIMMGRDEYSTVNIVGGEGNDTIFVGGRDDVTDAVVHDVGMLTNINLSAGGVDKVHTYAAANAKIVLNDYDPINYYSGVVLHDPEIPYIKNLTEAIRDGLIAVDGDAIVAIDRDETSTGVDRKTRITVNNKDSAYQSMIRLFGYKDNKDEYGDDYGQLLGFTSSAGGTLDASTIKEDVVLIGNKDNSKTGGSTLTGTAYDDTIFAGAQDVVDAGAGTNLIVLDDTLTRDAAAVVLGAGNNVIENLQSDFDSDVLDITAIGSKAEVAFADGTLTITDPTTKTVTTATDPLKAADEFIEVNLLDGSTLLKAAVAEVGGTIVVEDDEANYYVAKDAAIDFSNFNDNVLIDVDGDWEESNFVGDTNITLGSGVDTLIGSKGMTYFKGGADDETLVAGTGESSLYGGGGKNVLVGATPADKTGSTEFFVIGINNGAQNTISAFEFIEDGGSNQATFDNLNLGMADGNEVTDIKVDGNDVVIAVKGNESGATEKATIVGAAGQEMLVDRGTDTETVAQIAATEVTVNNSYVDFYAATDDTNGATVKVGNVESTEIWLGGPPIDHDKAVPEFTSSKFTVIDASGSSATALMAGNELANTIIGGSGTASMWGGYGNANDVMIAGTGHNEFYYEMGNGNDTIVGTNEGDIVHLGATLDQIDFNGTYMDGSSIVVKFTDGGQLNINNSGTDVTFSFDDGTAVKANRQTGQFE